MWYTDGGGGGRGGGRVLVVMVVVVDGVMAVVVVVIGLTRTARYVWVLYVSSRLPRFMEGQRGDREVMGDE